ncbi:MAG: hypothetical protein HOQ05_01175 [Corynebacteriales bacterium]|nr:hypothetical protein [Mycobacteriales bacterium]
MESEQHPADAFSPPRVDQHAMGATAIGILSFCMPTLFLCYIPLLAGLLQLAGGVTAVAFGIKGRRKVMRSMGRLNGEGWAITGMIIGVVVVLSGFLITVIGFSGVWD